MCHYFKIANSILNCKSIVLLELTVYVQSQINNRRLHLKKDNDLPYLVRETNVIADNLSALLILTVSLMTIFILQNS